MRAASFTTESQSHGENTLNENLKDFSVPLCLCGGSLLKKAM